MIPPSKPYTTGLAAPRKGRGPNWQRCRDGLLPKPRDPSPIGDADLIASASDRAAIGHLPIAIDYQVEDRGQGLGSGLEMSHLLSGRKHFWQLADEQHQALKDARSRADYLMEREESAIPDWVRQEDGSPKSVLVVLAVLSPGYLSGVWG